MATENGHLNLNSLDEDTEDKYDCNRLFTSRMCKSDTSGECEWVKKFTLIKGKMRGACVLKGTVPSADKEGEPESSRGSRKSKGEKRSRGSKSSRQ